MSDWRSDPDSFNQRVIQEFRANGGTVGGELGGMSLLLLTTSDARNGEPHTTPLAYHRRDDSYLVIASNGGAARHPKWFRNLERDKYVTVEVGLETFTAEANILDASQRDSAFADIVTRSPSAGAFQEKAGRRIPVIELKRCNPPKHGAAVWEKRDTALAKQPARADEQCVPSLCVASPLGSECEGLGAPRRDPGAAARGPS